MLQEKKIYQVFDIEGRKYYILSLYFMDTRILLDMLVESESVLPSKRPQTVEDHLIVEFQHQKNRKHTGFQLRVNDQRCREVRQSISPFDERSLSNQAFLKMEIPAVFEHKKLDLMQIEFDPLEREEEIKEVFLHSRIHSQEFLVGQKHIVPMGVYPAEYEFAYTDPETGESKCLYIQRLFKHLEAKEESSPQLMIQVEYENELVDFQMVIDEELHRKLEVGSSFSMGIAHANGYRKAHRQGLNAVQKCIGRVERDKESETITLFSIHKRRYGTNETRICKK